jgi:hypothetical protein
MASVDCTPPRRSGWRWPPPGRGRQMIPAGTGGTGQEIFVPPDLPKAGTGQPEEPDVPEIIAGAAGK